MVVSGRENSDEPIAARVERRRAESALPGKVPDDFARGAFPKTRRLLSHAAFQDVYRTGRRQFSTHLSAFYLLRGAEGDSEKKVHGGGPARLHSGLHSGPRIGLAVASALGGAVVRNRIRRRLRAAVRSNLHGLTVPVDVVIQAKKSVLAAEFVELVREIENAFKAIENAAASSRFQAASKGQPARRRKLQGNP